MYDPTVPYSAATALISDMSFQNYVRRGQFFLSGIQKPNVRGEWRFTRDQLVEVAICGELYPVFQDAPRYRHVARNAYLCKDVTLRPLVAAVSVSAGGFTVLPPGHDTAMHALQQAFMHKYAAVWMGGGVDVEAVRKVGSAARSALLLNVGGIIDAADSIFDAYARNNGPN